MRMQLTVCHSSRWSQHHSRYDSRRTSQLRRNTILLQARSHHHLRHRNPRSRSNVLPIRISRLDTMDPLHSILGISFLPSRRRSIALHLRSRRANLLLQYLLQQPLAQHAIRAGVHVAWIYQFLTIFASRHDDEDTSGLDDVSTAVFGKS